MARPLVLTEGSTLDGGVWFFRAQNLRPLEISENDRVFVSIADAARLERNRLQANDVIMTRTGANAGDCALFDSDKNAVASSHTFIIRSCIWPHSFLVAFMNSYYGRSQIMKGRYGAAQPEVAPNYLRSIWIPRFSSNFYTAIGYIFTSSKGKRDLALTHLASAEQTLLRALGLENWQPPEPLTYTRSSQDTFAAGRLDAEHFKPKYANLEAHIRTTRHFVSLGSLLVINERGIQPEYGEVGLPFVNSKHVTNGEVRLNDDNRLALSNSSTLKIKKGDVLINGTGVGTIGRTAPYLHDQEAIPDNHVTVLRPKEYSIDPVYLSVFLNSLAGQYQVSKWLRGSSGQIELYPNDIAQFLVWIAPDEIQRSIKTAIDSAFAKKRNAINLLNAAKRAVEIAIESGEATALEFLKTASLPCSSSIAADAEAPSGLQ